MQSIISDLRSHNHDSYLVLKDTEARLKESEERYRLIADHGSDMILIIKADNLALSYVSPSFEKVLGYKAEMILGNNCMDLIYVDDRNEAMDAMLAGLKIGFGLACYRLIKKDNTELWVESLGKFIDTETGKHEVLVLVRDISERKMAEEALQASELRLRRITDNMLDSVCSLNEKGRFDYVSPSHQFMMGFEPAELMGKHNLRLLHPEDQDRMRKFFKLLFSQEPSGIIQYRAQHKDGHYIWMESVGRVVIDENDGSKQCVVGTREISARKQVEAELRQREEDLQNKVNYLNTLINNMNELCYTIDRNCRLTFVNQKALESTGFELDEVVGRSIFDFVPEFDQPEVSERIRHPLEDGDNGIHEHGLIGKNGRKMLIRLKSSPIIENGEITGALILAEDITQQRKIEKEMARFGQMNTVGEMAASIGHEIRNPMTTVQGFLQMMSQNEKLSEQKPYFDLMLEELTRANSIITEFLSLAKDKMVDLHPQDLNKVVETLAPLLVADAIKADKCISFDLSPIPDLLLDEKEIRQLILNLVRNGLEAMSAGGTITIKTYQETDGAVIAVLDEGAGIDPDILDQLGTPFLTSKENGIGLGLAVCYSIVARHNARLKFDTSSTGTTFFVTFPR